jgi:hypothetical protein
MAFVADYCDYNFVAAMGDNNPKAIAPTIERLKQATAGADRKIAEIDGVAGIMLTCDDFVTGMDQFGRYIQPLMKSRAHILQAAA